MKRTFTSPSRAAFGDDVDGVLALVAHELRGPTAAIVSWAHLLRQRPIDSETKRGIEVIHRNATVLARLIDDLLDHAAFACGDARLALERVDVVQLLRPSIDGLRLAANERAVDLRLQSDDRAAVQADPVRLRQVLNNLLENAIEYSPHGSVVDVEIARPHGQVTIRVRDAGMGISPKFLPRVFDWYRREGRSTARGLGIGLAVARALVELHGGTITAESAGEGLGATFTVVLPAADDGPLRGR
jgi:signal transduction histidine kinase